MNYRKRLVERNKIVQLIRQDCRTGSKCNCFQLNNSYSKNHEYRKFDIFYELRKKKCDVWIEPILVNGSRPDILSFNFKTGKALIIEVLYYEELINAKRKTEKYPKHIDKIYISADAPFNPNDLDI